jgi:two-component sensor histidine kinase
MANDWHEARIDELVRLELTTFGALDGAQFSAEGPPIGLQPNAARNIGLALHELATNAMQTWSAPGARRQGCRALGACQPW